MVFSSLVFLNCFLAPVLLVYFLSPKSWRNPILLAASIAFYAFGEPKYLTVMFFSVAVNYLTALAIERAPGRRLRNGLLILALILNCGNLVVFKYLDFILENLNLALPAGMQLPLVRLVMPIGISFYTFQAISYVVDVWKGTVKAQRNFYDLALFIMFFPQLIAGPILKYHEFGPQMADHDSGVSGAACGLRRFAVGLGKKVLLANTIGIFADRVFSVPVPELPVWMTWLGCGAYALQIYFDFSGYSDMAIGLGKIFGFSIPDNFNYPYISRSITEFWRRWHISLSSWVRDYLYFPLGGSRCSMFRACCNTMFVFVVVGLWHGASWSFIVWGAWFGLFMVLERLSGYKKWQERVPAVFQHLYFLLVYLLSLAIFRMPTLRETRAFMSRMFGSGAGESIRTVPADTPEVLALIFGLIAMLPVFSRFWREGSDPRKRFAQDIAALVIFLVSMAFLCGATYNPFIYFRF